MTIAEAWTAYHRFLLSKARSYARDISGAEDLESAVWVRVLGYGWERIDQRNLSGYLRTVLRHIAIDRSRVRASTEVSLDLPLEWAAEGASYPAALKVDSVAEHAEVRERFERVKQALAQLSPTLQRAVAIASEYQHPPVGLRGEGHRIALHRARKALREADA